MEKVLVVFGGRSSEYEVACRSAAYVVSQIDKSEYEVHTVGVTKSGRWMYTEASPAQMADLSWEKLEDNRACVLSPDSRLRGLQFADGEQMPVDVVFPVMHGKNGEDGAIAALLQLAGIPQTSTTMTSGANSMDKVLTKIICDKAGIPQADFEFFYARDLVKDTAPATDLIESRFEYPVFVKPSSAGSSVGVNKCHDRNELVSALLEAAKHDFKVLVEECIVGSEVEAAVLGNTELVCPTCGQIAPSEEFYSYDSKYNDENSKLFIPAKISEKAYAAVIDYAKKVYSAMECQGLSRVDFFVIADDKIIFNELNTIPGFTDISMYPKLMAYGGIDGTTLADKLIELALSEDRI